MATNRVNEIDLLRFLAALSVVFFHYSFKGYAADNMSMLPYPLMVPIAKYGFLGVELFFMISGFVILMTASSGCLKKFTISRIVRLYPGFWICCTITFLATVTIGGERYSASVIQYLINMTMFSGFLSIPSIDGAYWSIFVELQFYALVALVLLLKKIHLAQIFLILWLISTIALDAFPVGILRSILIANYSPYFIAGAISFLVWSSGLSLTRIITFLVAWLVALRHSLGSISEFEQHYNSSLNEYVIIGIICAFFTIMYLISIRRSGFFGKKEWITVGALTYPLYLIHQNIGFMIFNSAQSFLNPHVLFWGTLILMLSSAYLVNVLFEQKYSRPLRNFLNQGFSSLGKCLTPYWQKASDWRASNPIP